MTTAARLMAAIPTASAWILDHEDETYVLVREPGGVIAYLADDVADWLDEGGDSYAAMADEIGCEEDEDLARAILRRRATPEVLLGAGGEPVLAEVDIVLPADGDADDCHEAAVDAVVEVAPELAGWDLKPRWHDADREAVQVTVPIADARQVLRLAGAEVAG